MRFMSQTVQLFKNASFSIDDSRRSWCIMVVSDAHNVVRVSIFPKHQV